MKVSNSIRQAILTSSKGNLKSLIMRAAWNLVRSAGATMSAALKQVWTFVKSLESAVMSKKQQAPKPAPVTPTPTPAPKKAVKWGVLDIQTGNIVFTGTYSQCQRAEADFGDYYCVVEVDE